MSKKTIFQTLADRGNPQEIIENGPYRCTKSPWLGEGYYFWDTFIELAHWWGEQGYHGKYVITKMDIGFNPDEILDLVGNTEQIQMFYDYASLLSKTLATTEITVGQVIEHMKAHTSFPYKAIRVEGRRSLGYFSFPYLKHQLVFKLYNKPYADFLPAIQICFVDKSILDKYQLSIVYPDFYMDNYSI